MSKKVLLTFMILACFLSCKLKSEEGGSSTSGVISSMEKAKLSGVIYETNIRQYSSEGTFKAFTRDIPKIKELGVKYVWLMPIFPISQVKRKATGGIFVSELDNEEDKAKMLGSYYAVADYKGINKNFGSIDDFRELVRTIHDNEMYVILDWVPNHTGWDHPWITNRPEYYTKNAQGMITDPLNPDGTSMGWNDVADLNYDNPKLRQEMIESMKHWVVNEGVDGFRCDVAGSVPLDFWETAIPELRKEKDLFMLAEAWEPELMGEGLFDMVYSWGTHHLMNNIVSGENSVLDWDERMEEIDSIYHDQGILMNFITNHDENSWNGTISERLGEGTDIFTVLSYLTPGMPLIYSGQEYGLSHRLKFFEKDSIPKTQEEEWQLLSKLGTIKRKHESLFADVSKANYSKLTSSSPEEVLAFKRSRKGDALIFIGNLSNQKVNFIPDFHCVGLDVFTNEEIEFAKGSNYELKPWEFIVLEQS